MPTATKSPASAHSCSSCRSERTRAGIRFRVSKGQEQSLAAGYIPFQKTKAQRLAIGDPRLSIEERYPNLRGYYYNAITISATLVDQRYMLQEDANRLLNQLLDDMLASSLLPKRGEFLIKPIKGGHAELVKPEVHAIEGVEN